MWSTLRTLSLQQNSTAPPGVSGLSWLKNELPHFLFIMKNEDDTWKKQSGVYFN
jgi:hypothetical protein